MKDGRRIALNAALMLLKQAIMAVLGVVFVGYLARKVGVAAWGGSRRRSRSRGSSRSPPASG